MPPVPTGKSCRVLALVERDVGSARAIAARLLQEFALPARPGFEGALTQRGVVVATTGELGDAQAAAARVAQAGASFRILDSAGTVLDQGGPAPRGSWGVAAARSAQPSVADRTQLGGFHAGGPPAPAARTAAATGVSANDLDLLFADAGLASGTHPTVSAGALAAAAMDRTLQGIDEGALVLLDGTAANEGVLTSAAVGIERRSLGERPLSLSTENQAIELDAPYEAPPEEIEPLDLLDPLTVGEGTQSGLGKTRRSGSARKAPPLTLLGGRLRDFPRLRVSLGFVAALALSSLVPLCHTGSVMSDRVASLRSDLATFRAHGHRLVRPADYRAPQQVEAEIASMKLRHGAFALLIWVVLCSGLLFLWFRFT